MSPSGVTVRTWCATDDVGVEVERPNTKGGRKLGESSSSVAAVLQLLLRSAVVGGGRPTDLESGPSCVACKGNYWARQSGPRTNYGSCGGAEEDQNIKVVAEC